MVKQANNLADAVEGNTWNKLCIFPICHLLAEEREWQSANRKENKNLEGVEAFERAL